MRNAFLEVKEMEKLWEELQKKLRKVEKFWFILEKNSMVFICGYLFYILDSAAPAIRLHGW
jgi:hypothetical protein